MRSVILILAMITMMLPNSYSDLDGGQHKIEEGYLIDLGHSPEMIKAGEESILAINLVNDTIKELIVFEKAWVRISRGNNVVFSGTFHPEQKHISFSYVFPQEGNYEIKIRFFEDNKNFLEEDFFLKVGENVNTKLLWSFLLGLIIGLAVILLYTILRNKSTLNIKNSKCNVC